MKKLRSILIAIVLTALLAIIIVQHLRTKSLLAEMIALRAQFNQMSLLRDENQRLTVQLRAASETSQPSVNELARFRAQATTLRQLQQENAGLKAAREGGTNTNPAPEHLSDNPFDRNHGAGASLKVSHAKYWGYALINYAANNQGRFPATFAEAAPYLHDELPADAKAQAMLQATTNLFSTEHRVNWIHCRRNQQSL